MDQYLLIPFLGGWTSIYQLFWGSPGVQGFDTLPDLSTAGSKNPSNAPPTPRVSQWHRPDLPHTELLRNRNQEPLDFPKSQGKTRGKAMGFSLKTGLSHGFSMVFPWKNPKNQGFPQIFSKQSLETPDFFPVKSSSDSVKQTSSTNFLVHSRREYLIAPRMRRMWHVTLW